MSTKLHTYSYRNITISGVPGCGSTTLLNMLREHLKFDGWKGFSGGEFMRAYAAENGMFNDKIKLHHPATVYGDDFDREVDFGIREKLENQQKWIIESWLSGFMAQGVKGVLKVLMTCSQASVRIDRIVNRDKVTVQTAKKHVLGRYKVNLSKWARMYAPEWKKWVVETGKMGKDEPIDFWSPDIYDVVIDTFSHNQQQTLDIVLNAIETPKKNKKINC